MLSAKELFKYRTGLEKTMPPKGGEKEYMPDGSWLQDKCIESFNRERERVLAEPRVVRSHDLLKGEWNPDVGLLELFKEMRNFWEHMGFVDQKRKWLYPEEALFLMETNVLEMWYQGLPMSIQEAYSTLIGEQIKLEYYQVYAHLRRVGYVVLRHQGRQEFTKYERQIGLDKLVSGKKERKREKRKTKTTKEESLDESGSSLDKDEATYKTAEIPNNDGDGDKTNEENRNIDVKAEDGSQLKKPKTIDDAESEDKRSTETEERMNMTEHSKKENAQHAFNVDKLKKYGYENMESKSSNSDKVKFSGYEEGAKGIEDVDDKLIDRIQTKLSIWNFDEIQFPDFKQMEEKVLVHKPITNYIPQGSDVCFNESEYSFDKKQYINTKKVKRKQKLIDEALLKELDFSYPDIMTGWHKVKKSCTNWKEYKAAVKREKASWDRSAMFPHLYGDKVKPLVKPELATSTSAVLKQLRIVKDDECQRCNIKPDIMPDFDVYAPNTKFKKSKPGIPDFRVKVAKNSDPFPDLKILNAINSYLSDEAPLQWAVVDCGNIAFYSMSDMSLPQDISLG